MHLDHEHPHTHPHTDDHTHAGHHHHDHDHCAPEACGSCGGCDPMAELIAMMKYMVNHNAAHANELAGLAGQLEKAGNHMAYEQVMQAVSDFEKGNLRLSATLAALEK